MRKILLAVAVLCAALFMYFNRSVEESVKPQAILRVGAECDYVPNSWEEARPSPSNVPIINHNGYYAEGYDIQIAKIVARELDMLLEVRKIAWNDLLPALNNGEIDAIFSSMLDTKERKNVVAFSNVYEANRTEYGIIIDSVSPFINAKNLKDFEGAKIIGEKGTKLDEVIDQIPGVIHVKPADKVQGMIDAVLQNKADGAAIDTDTGSFYELTNKNLTLIKFPENGGFELGFTGVCAGIRKDDKELLHRVNIALGKISRSERQKIMDTAKNRMMTGLNY